MSCKLHPLGQSIDVQSWRPDGGGVSPRRDLGASGFEAELQSAYQQGVAAGETSGAQRAATQLAPVMQNFSSVIQAVAGARAQARQEAEESVVQLAVAVARRVLIREISTDPEAILGLVKSALERINAREVHRLRLSAEDAEVVRQNRNLISIPPSVEIAADPALTPGSAFFETARGEVDASVQTQLDEIQRGFADLVARRKSLSRR